MSQYSNNDAYQGIEYSRQSGGMNLRVTDLAQNQTADNTDMTVVQNMNLFRIGGFSQDLGNTKLITTKLSSSPITGIGVYNGNIIYSKRDSLYYILPISGGAEQRIANNLTLTVNDSLTQFVNFAGYAIMVGASTYPAYFDGAQLQYIGTPASHPNLPDAWYANTSTSAPTSAAVWNGTRLVLAAKNVVYVSALGKYNDFLASNDAFFFSGFYGDNTDIVSLDTFGPDVIISTASNKMYRLTGQTYADYQLIPIANNSSIAGPNNSAQVDQILYFFNGKGVYKLDTTDYGQIKLTNSGELTGKVKPIFSNTEPELILKPYNPANDNTTNPRPISRLHTTYTTNKLYFYYSDGTYSFNPSGIATQFLTDKALIYDFDVNAWTFRQTTPFTTTYHYNDSSSTNAIYGGTQDGQIIQEFTGTGTFYNPATGNMDFSALPYLRSPWIYGDDNFNVKRYMGLYFLFRTATTTNCTLNVYKDYDNKTVAYTENFTLQGASTSLRYGISRYGEYATNTLTSYKEFNYPIDGRGLQWELIVTNQPKYFQVLGVKVGIANGAQG